MWTKTVPTEPGFYWVKSRDGQMLVIYGEKEPIRRNTLKFRFFDDDDFLGSAGEQIVKDGARFWSERILPPELPDSELLHSD